jgi:hypothetical protein
MGDAHEKGKDNKELIQLHLDAYHKGRWAIICKLSRLCRLESREEEEWEKDRHVNKNEGIATESKYVGYISEVARKQDCIGKTKARL